MEYSKQSLPGAADRGLPWSGELQDCYKKGLTLSYIKKVYNFIISNIIYGLPVFFYLLYTSTVMDISPVYIRENLNSL